MDPMGKVLRNGNQDFIPMKKHGKTWHLNGRHIPRYPGDPDQATEKRFRFMNEVSGFDMHWTQKNTPLGTDVSGLEARLLNIWSFYYKFEATLI